MATASSKPLNDLIECSICTEVYNDPRSLPCLHTFCLACCEGFCRGKLPRSVVECPLCRDKFAIPENGVSGLKKNFMIETLRQNLSINREGNEIRTSLPSFCDEHANKTLDWYCVDCGKIACSSCKNKYHKSHNVIECDDVADELRPALTSHVVKLDTLYKNWGEGLRKINDEENKFMNSVEKTEYEIANEAKRLQQLIERHKSELLAEVSVKKRERLKLVDNLKQELHQQMVSVKSLLSYTTELMKNRPEDIVKEATSLGELATKLLDLATNSALGNKLGSYSLSFVSHNESKLAIGNLTESAKQGDKVNDAPDSSPHDGLTAEALYNYRAEDYDELSLHPGDFITDIECYDGGWWRGSCRGCNGLFPSNFVQLREKRTTVTFIDSLPEENWIGGLALLDKELYVCYAKQSNIAVYDIESRNLRRRLSVPGVSCVADMASSQKDRCIYVSEQTNKVVHRIEAKTTDTAEKFTKWNVDDVPWGLSVTADHNVIVTCSKVNKAKVFTTFGNLLDVIDLKNVLHPLHTIQLTPDKFVVCHGSYLDGKLDLVHRVCIVDRDGNVQQPFGSTTGSDENHVFRPERLAVVGGSIFVVDMNNYRVLKLSHELKFIQSVVPPLSGDPYCYPCRMCFDEQSGRLYLGVNKLENGEWKTGHVNVYTIGN